MKILSRKARFFLFKWKIINIEDNWKSQLCCPFFASCDSSLPPQHIFTKTPFFSRTFFVNSVIFHMTFSQGNYIACSREKKAVKSMVRIPSLLKTPRKKKKKKRLSRVRLLSLKCHTRRVNWKIWSRDRLTWIFTEH